MTKRTCDGQDDGLIMYLDVEGRLIEDPALAVEVVSCDCGAIFDDTRHELAWPHDYRPPSRRVTDLTVTADYL